MLYVGIDLGGTNIAAGIVNDAGDIIAKDSVPTHLERGPEPIIKDMAELSKRLVTQSGHTLDDIAAVGVGVPGVANNDTGIIYNCTNLKWHMVPFRDQFVKHLDKPIAIENDATVAGLAEATMGVSKGVKNSIFLTLGTGVGGGVVIDGKVFSGSHHVGSELGHMTLNADGPRCSCGSDGCWEKYCSATTLIEEGTRDMQSNPQGAISKAVGGDASKLNAKIVLDAAKAGDPGAAAIFDRYIYYMAKALISLINTFDPEIIAIGGGVSHAGAFLVDAIRERMKEYIFYKDVPYARVELAQLGNEAGIIGAAMLGKAAV